MVQLTSLKNVFYFVGPNYSCIYIYIHTATKYLFEFEFQPYFFLSVRDIAIEDLFVPDSFIDSTKFIDETTMLEINEYSCCITSRSLAGSEKKKRSKQFE